MALKNMNAFYSRDIVCFFTIYFIYSVKSLLFYLAIDENVISGVITGLNVLLFLISFIVMLSGDARSRVIFIVVVLIAGLNIILENNSYALVYIVIYSICYLTSRISWNKIISTTLLNHYIIIVFIAVPIIFFSQRFYIQDERFGERFTAGFEHPNTYGQYALFLFTTITLYLDSCTKQRVVQWIIACSAAFILWLGIYYSYSRTTSYMLVMCLIIFSFTRFLKNTSFQSVLLSRLWLLLTLCIIAFQFYSIIFYHSMANGIKLNEILSGRLWYGNSLYEHIGMPNLFFGYNIENYLPIDFFFIKYFYGLGIVISTASIIVAYVFIRRNAYSWYTWGCLFLLLAVSITESYLTTPFFCIALFIIFSNSRKHCQSQKLA